MDHRTALLRREIRERMLRVEFVEVLRLARDGVAAATAAGDRPLQRRFGCDEATALLHVGRLADALAAADGVAASARHDGEPQDLARACNVGALAAARLGRRADAMTRLDTALAAGEHLQREADRLDVLGKAACSAGAIGMVELGDAVFDEVMRHITAAPEVPLAPSAVLWLVGQHVLVRLWRGMAAEHAARPGDAAPAYEGAVLLCRSALRQPGLPAVPEAAFRGMAGFALTALGRAAQAAPLLAQARTVLPAEPFQMLLGGVEITTGTSALRTAPPASPAALHTEGARLVAFARRCADVRFEAEIWLRWGRAAEAAGDPGRAAVARERVDDLVARLDWSGRLDDATLLSFRSGTLTRIARGEGWTAGGAPTPP